MRKNAIDIPLTAIAPIIWGSTYLVTTEWLPNFSAMTVAMLRALPAGLLLLLIVRQLPTGIWWFRSFVLGALNISIFLTLLFVAAYRLPGGVAGTVLAAQPLIVVFMAAYLLSDPLRPLAIIGALIGLGGVALLVLAPGASLDVVGVSAGLSGALSMALGGILSRKWRPDVSALTFTAWQLSAGGLLLVPAVLLLEPPIPLPSIANLAGLLWLGLIGAALTYALWFRGIEQLTPALVSSLLFLSPLTAVLLGWGFLGQALTAIQFMGIALVVGSIWTSQWATR